MIKKRNYKIYVVMNLIIIVIASLLIRMHKIEEETYKFPISIINKSGINYEYSDVEYQTLYNTVFVPLNETFTGIFGSEYVQNESQKITYKGMTVDIKLENNIISVPNIYEDNNIVVDNSVDVEIEMINEKRYIPIYLLANLPNVIVKIDNKEVYNESNYLNSIDAIKDNREKHKIVILTEQEKSSKKTNYVGEQPGALWREEALKRIEKNRKKNLTISIKNQENSEIQNSSIQIKSLKNDFTFGTAVNLNTMDSVDTKYFNTIVSESSFKWKFLDSYKNADRTSNFAKSKGINLKGHNLWWDYVCINGLKRLVKSDNNEDVTFEKIYNMYNNNEINIEEANNYIEILKNKFENLIYNHIQEEVLRYPEITEWDVINEPINYQYFKYFLYDKNLLKDNSFLNTTVKQNVTYTDNDEYYKFMANCYELARKSNKSAKLILNDEKIRGNEKSGKVTELINIINKIKEKTTNLESIGIQCHQGNGYLYTPQGLYNQINLVLNQTNLNDAIISEYDNYSNSKLDSYTQEEKKTRANYIKDMLIMAYSNDRISEFTTWVYYGPHFCDEEREAYEETVYPWLNYTEAGVTNEDGYTTRLYKGTYDLTITLPNGKTKNAEFIVSDNSSDTIEILINSDINKINLKQEPSKKIYYRNDTLDLTDGIIELIYDDGTTKEVNINKDNVKVTGFDSSKLGKQTITIDYNGTIFKYEIEINETVENKIKNSINVIANKNNTIKANNTIIYSNSNINGKYIELLNGLNDISNNTNSLNKDHINKIFDIQYNLIDTIVDEYNNEKINITKETYKELLIQLMDTSECYKELFELYIEKDDIDNSEVKETINTIINRYNDNTDILINFSEEMINREKDKYNNISSDDMIQNYLNKRSIENECKLISKILENDIKTNADNESKKIVAEPSTKELTNQSIIVTIKLPDNSYLKDYENNQIIFDENATKEIIINIRGYEYKYNLTISNIDKKAPTISNVINGTDYLKELAPKAEDENLKDVKLYYEGNIVNNYYNGAKLTDEGSYVIVATDKAGNETKISFTIYNITSKEYKITEGFIKNIPKKTEGQLVISKLNIKNDYKLFRNNNLISSTINIATGDKLEVEKETFILIVKGDITKTSEVNVRDLVKLRKYLLDEQDLDKIEKMAADVNEDSKVDIKDLAAIRTVILK